MASLDPVQTPDVEVPFQPSVVTEPAVVRRVAVVGGSRLHRDVLTLVLEKSPTISVDASVAFLDELDRADPPHAADTAVIVMADGSGVGLLARGGGAWSDRTTQPTVVLGWDTDRRVLVRLLTDSAVVASTPAATPRDDGFDRLTRREIDVLLLLADGASSASVAAELRISPNTVRTHVTNLLRKLGAHTRLEAVARTRDAVARERRRRTPGVAR
jgi:DNA-binding CsgD family transcriptional regulator